ncbi:MAG TPA: RidA family protein [Thermomicrobiales bacterium]|nr:RidA family protein [Thermomicrobiales bacterium]
MSTKSIIESSNAPAAIGPYSQAIEVNGMIYTSGVIPLDPQTMEVTGSTIEEQTERVMQSLKALLEDAGSSLAQVVKTTCFLDDLGDFAAFNGVYETYFAESKPARSTVEVAALPKAVKVEIEAVAIAGS